MAVNLNQTKGIRASREVSGEQAQTSPNLLKWVIIGLAIASVTELLLWRTFSRIGVFIPKHDTFQTVYTILTQIGVIVLNFAVVLAVASLVLTLLRLRELGYFGQRSKVESRRSKVENQRSKTENLKSFDTGPSTFDQSSERSVLMTVAVAAILMVLGFTFVQMALVQHPLVSFLLRLAQIVAFVALGVAYWRSNRSWQARTFISLMLFGYVIQITAKLMLDYPAQQTEWNWLQNLYMPMLMLGEAAVLINGFGLYLVYGGGEKNPARSMARNWPAFVGALAIAGIFLGLTFLTIAESDIVPILGLYALGYTMQLPLALYVIALFFLLYTVFYNLGHLRQGQGQRAAAFGLILIFTGGYLFNISNQYLFALIGLLLLTRPEILKEW